MLVRYLLVPDDKTQALKGVLARLTEDAAYFTIDERGLPSIFSLLEP